MDYYFFRVHIFLMLPNEKFTLSTKVEQYQHYTSFKKFTMFSKHLMASYYDNSM